MTTYCSSTDLDLLLDGFVNKYYGTYLDEGSDLTLSTLYYEDLNRSFVETNELLGGVPHIKTLPFATQSDGNYPVHVRMLQGNLLIFNRLRSRHYGEFTDEFPSWINAFKNRADGILASIRGQNVVFDQDITVGESGIGVGTFSSRSGLANLYTNWETGVYTADDYPKNYVITIDGTSEGNSIGSSTFKWSNDGGVSWIAATQYTATTWVDIEDGITIRWEPIGTGTLQCNYGDVFQFRCVPYNITPKSGGIRQVTFLRG